jgi:preprotein translocase subunit YajC
MSSLFSSTTSAANQFNLMSFLPMIIIFILFWILLIRPQQKKAKEHTQMVNELQKGDEVISNSGILGKIDKVTEQFIHLEIAKNVVISMQKTAIAAKVAKGTYSV